MRVARVALPCALLLTLAAPGAALAETACAAAGRGASASASASARSWPAPLDRTLAFHARDVSLRDALDRLAAAARLRFSYSADLLPLDRRVCLSRDTVTVGDALVELLRGTTVEPVAAGGTQVVLAPRRTAGAAEPAELGRVAALERIVVTGSASGAPQAGLPVALNVVDGERLGQQTRPLGTVMSASGGPWAWSQSPSSLVARYGSIRGASSFGASHPKVFIDGIEVANPLLVTQIAPEAVERVEVIQGPQGAALYGTGAISGVINIVTRHEGADGGAARVRVRSGFGRAESDFSPGGALSQEHALSLRAGDRMRSAGLDVGVGSTGEFVRDGASRYLLATGNARRVGARTIVTATGRFYSARAGVAASPLLGGAVGPVSPSSSPAQTQRVTQYTLGGAVKHVPDEVWTHSLVIGMDGGRLSGLADEHTPVPAAAEAALRTSDGGADLLTLRASSVARVTAGEGAEVALTFATEHSALRERAEAPDAGTPGSPPPLPLDGWTSSSALVAQANTALAGRVHLTGGVRIERNEGLAGSRFAALPVLGAAVVTGFGDATLKVRAAYGKGVRPARTPTRESALSGSYAQLRMRDLSPEEQSGIEGGFDLAIGSALTLQVTRYDQLATGLIQRVALPVDTAGGRPRRTPYVLQNVGEISNRGWEMQGTAAAGPLSLSAAMSLVDSRVRRLAPGYTGDLRPGDRMLEVPARTMSLTAAWAGAGGSASLTAYRASDWINYDRLALARDFASGERDAAMSGADLRGYWRRYEGITRLNAGATVDLHHGLTLLLAGDNLLDRQRGEPDNLTVLPGRTLTVGVRAEF